MQTRTTTDIVTPNGHKVTLKDWISGREFEALSAPLLKLYKVNTNKGVIDEPTVSGEVMTEMNRIALETWLVSVDGATENVYDAVLDMRQEDYQFVKTAIDEISKKK